MSGTLDDLKAAGRHTTEADVWAQIAALAAGRGPWSAEMIVADLRWMASQVDLWRKQAAAGVPAGVRYGLAKIPGCRELAERWGLQTRNGRPDKDAAAAHMRDVLGVSDRSPTTSRQTSDTSPTPEDGSTPTIGEVSDNLPTDPRQIPDTSPNTRLVPSEPSVVHRPSSVAERATTPTANPSERERPTREPLPPLTAADCTGPAIEAIEALWRAFRLIPPDVPVPRRDLERFNEIAGRYGDDAVAVVRWLLTDATATDAGRAAADARKRIHPLSALVEPANVERFRSYATKPAAPAVDPAVLAWEDMIGRKGWRSGKWPNRPAKFGSRDGWDLADDVAEHARRWHALDAVGGWRGRLALPAMGASEWAPKQRADFAAGWCAAWTTNRRGAA